MSDHTALSVEEMRAAEEAVFSRGVQSYALMKRAGLAVAHAARTRYPGRSFLVLAGPGNNGADGFIAAQALLAYGARVEVAAYGNPRKLTGDAARARGEYQGEVGLLAQTEIKGNPVVIDALFGTGLTRPIVGEAAALMRAIAAAKLEVVAVDIPSGVQGDSGEAMGAALQATLTVTFARKKWGHLLMPGRLLSGEVLAVDIGVDAETIAAQEPKTAENHAELWRSLLPWPQPGNHKYHRGHTLVWGGEAIHAGAAKLAALSALRMGSGLVSILCRKDDVPVYASSAWSLMTATRDHYRAKLADERCNTVAIGPGAGVSKTTRQAVLAGLDAKKRMVLDADALTSFEHDPKELFRAVKSPCVLTPHMGEFERLFGIKGNKLLAARKAAAMSHAVVVLKGYDTVIAAPDGRAIINTNAPPELATAGAGDVLCGIVAGLLAQGMDAFAAASAAVYIHGEAAEAQGVGLIAEDLPGCIPAVLHMLKNQSL